MWRGTAAALAAVAILLAVAPAGSFAPVPRRARALRRSLDMVTIPFPLPMRYQDQITALAGAWQYTGPMPPFIHVPRPGDPPAHVSAFLSLHENGTFVEAASTSVKLRPLLRGHWGVSGGRLVLAAERIKSPLEPMDTLLEGPMLALDEEDDPGEAAVTNAEGAPIWRAMARVRKGVVYVGRFTYPPSHPSFLDDPMWSPEPAGTFDLVQVLGHGIEMEGSKAKALPPPGPPPTKYSKRDLAGRWVLKVIPAAWTGARASLMLAEVRLCANGTWESTAGLGTDTTLRGRWGVYADAPDPDRMWRPDEVEDKIWVLVQRFGLGRSSSYSGVFSEGPFLNQDDDKMYIGAVKEVTRLAELELEDNAEPMELPPVANAGNLTTAYTRTLEAKGVVMLGLGLEPVSVGRFAMTRIEAAEFKEGDATGDGQGDYWPTMIGRV